MTARKFSQTIIWKFTLNIMLCHSRQLHYINCGKLNSQVQAAEMGFFRRVDSVTLRDKVRSCEIRWAVNIKPLLRIERSQPLWFGHVSRMSHEILARHVLLAKPTWKRSRGRPRTRWSDDISDLACSHLGVEPAELPENREVFRGLPLPSLQEKRVWKLMNEIAVNKATGNFAVS